MISEAATTSSSLIWSAEPDFKAKFDRIPFALSHNLIDHPLFAMPRLFALAQRVKSDSNNIVYDAGDVRVEHRWNQRPPKQYTLEETLERIDHAGAWVILKHCELDPDYREVMEGVIADLSRMSGLDLGRMTKNAELQVMLTSPGRVTPYHIDNECNVLLQIRGEKDLYVFDRSDREILTEPELERFWVGDWNAGEYKARCQDRAYAFRLAPGKAVHIPVTSPHWVKNDANVSISLSINFEWIDELVPNVYRANFFLRRIGMKPRPPEQSKIHDSVKNMLVGVGFVPVRYVARSAVRFERRLRRAQLKKAS